MNVMCIREDSWSVGFERIRASMHMARACAWRNLSREQKFELRMRETVQRMSGMKEEDPYITSTP